MRASRLHFLAIVPFALLVTFGAACSGSTPSEGGSGPGGTPPATTATVGPSAAQVTLPGSATVQVPAGALASTLTVTLSAADAPVPTPAPLAGPVVKFTPHGTVFDAPVAISLAYAPGRDPSKLSVVRLPGDGGTWELVGGARFSGGVARFESTTFSYYAVVEGLTCEATDDRVACNAGCECCGTAFCVDVGTDPQHCGACGSACGAAAFCAAGGTCVALADATACENPSMYAIDGEVPLDVVFVSPEQTRDGLIAAQVSSALASACGGLSVTAVSQAAPGILDACTDEPLLRGTTLLLVGGGFGQRMARYLDRGLSAVSLSHDDVADRFTFTSRAGTVVADFAADLTPTHDWFVVALEATERGALVVRLYGLGWEGTPAAAWYFEQRLLPALVAGTRTWERYLVVEWRDDGDGAKGAEDTWTVLAQDVP